MMRNEILNCIMSNMGMTALQLTNFIKGVSSIEIQNFLKELEQEILIVKVKNIYYPISRVVSVFDNHNDELVEEYPLANLDLSIARKHIEENKKDKNLFLEYEIKTSNKDFFEKATNNFFDFQKYSYFLSCYYNN